MGAERIDAVIVGAGFSGLYMLHRLRGQGLSARVYEAGSGVGGTWFWNRYPGARVDIESLEYAYSFSDELDETWRWSERYAGQPELLAYFEHVAERFDLKRDIRLETRIAAAVFDEDEGRWDVTTDGGETVSSRFCIMATGCLSVPKEPDFPGAATFEGPTFHTARWPREPVDFTGQKVAVIGTGSSAIQTIPQIAAQAAHVTVFQRTANFSVPAHNGPMTPDQIEAWKAERVQRRREAQAMGFGVRQLDESTTLTFDVDEETRTAVYEDRWARGGFSFGGAFADIIIDRAANDTASEFVRAKIRGIVKDPDVAAKLEPRDFPLFTKRLCVDTGYFATFNRDNVTLVDLRTTPIEAITPKGPRTGEGVVEVDAIVYAIGFDAMTGALGKIDIRGRGGLALKDEWAAGPHTYLGLMMTGFPNLFIVTGPGSPSVLCNMAVAIEQHVEWISDCIAWLGERQVRTIEATAKAQADWVAHVNEVAAGTLYPQANSWYIGANVPGKPRVFMPYIGGFPAYRDKCDQVAAGGYEGCVLAPAASA